MDLSGNVNGLDQGGQTQEFRKFLEFLKVCNIVSLVASGFLMILFAFVFKSKVVDKMAKIPRHTGEMRQRKLGIFACFSNQDACLHSWCCPAPSHAKVFEQTGVVGYWEGFAANCFTIFGTACCQAMICVAVPWRMWTMWRYQVLMNYEADLVSTCAISCCCYPCEVGRQNMEVDMESGQSATCVCKVKEEGLLSAAATQQQMREVAGFIA